MPTAVAANRPDPRDKRFARPRRRWRMPWFFIACAIVLVGFVWLRLRVGPLVSSHGAERNAAPVRAPGGNGDW